MVPQIAEFANRLVRTGAPVISGELMVVEAKVESVNE
jgi:hypothetical protein